MVGEATETEGGPYKVSYCAAGMREEVGARVEVV